MNRKKEEEKNIKKTKGLSPERWKVDNCSLNTHVTELKLLKSHLIYLYTDYSDVSKFIFLLESNYFPWLCLVK